MNWAPSVHTVVMRAHTIGTVHYYHFIVKRLCGVAKDLR